ncbi:NYN domain-containing protein [Alkalihalobacillus sp. CinArs1]|uniref:NYN domain-containing protein n=1 Tax=Alkalihalobacillus sp. CinArs1 TaxID=2995314 RepID=UPI0022DD6099|nr:NYN domain-containing protein [Alkalihalobacillus sp. CinArs1]
MDVLLVDGYNIIGAWPELRNLKDNDFSKARELLIEYMAEYQAYTGFRVIVVFDAHLSRGVEKKGSLYGVEVIYTRENETADERIEKLARELKDIRTQVHVATSDYTEQWAIFGQGALRKSARELYNEMQRIEKGIEKRVDHVNRENRSSGLFLTDEVSEIFEKWRRGGK